MVHGCVQNQECEDQIAWVDQRTIGMVDIVKQMWSLRRLLSEFRNFIPIIKIINIQNSDREG